MTIPFKTDPLSADQHALFPGNVFDLLAEDHDCFLFRDLFEQLDTTALESQYSPQGQRTYHPRKVPGILIYGYSHGVFSSRQLEKRCREDLGFMYIAGMNCPNFRVLSDFRKNNADFFKSCFKQTVQLALRMKLASLGHVSLDGSQFKADSSKHKAMSYKHLKAKEAALMNEVEALIAQAGRCDAEEDAAYREKTGYELPADLRFKEHRLKTIRQAKAALEAREAELNPDQAIDDKKQISFADTEARIMGKGKDFAYRYNGQISVDSDHQIIVGRHLSQNANDQQEVGEALEAIKSATGDQLPEKMSLDNGYHSGANLQALEAAEIDSYVSVGQGEADAADKDEDNQGQLRKIHFIYDEGTDCFHCPGGHRLQLKQANPSGKRVYQAEQSDCATCPCQKRCCRSTTGQARTLTTDDKESLRQAMRDKMAAPEAKAVYRRRKAIVEPVFGHIKNGGFRGFSLRGKEKVAGEFSLVCAAHNLKKMVKAAMTGLVRPEFGQWVAKAG